MRASAFWPQTQKAPASSLVRWPYVCVLLACVLCALCVRVRACFTHTHTHKQHTQPVEWRLRVREQAAHVVCCVVFCV